MVTLGMMEKLSYRADGVNYFIHYSACGRSNETERPPLNSRETPEKTLESPWGDLVAGDGMDRMRQTTMDRARVGTADQRQLLVSLSPR